MFLVLYVDSCHIMTQIENENICPTCEGQQRGCLRPLATPQADRAVFPCTSGKPWARWGVVGGGWWAWPRAFLAPKPGLCWPSRCSTEALLSSRAWLLCMTRYHTELKCFCETSSRECGLVLEFSMASRLPVCSVLLSTVMAIEKVEGTLSLLPFPVPLQPAGTGPQFFSCICLKG